jgi:circadian clock protein KaiB
VNQAASRWSLTLYVSGASPLSTAAIENVRKICDERLKGQVDLQVVDVHEQPALVIADDVVAVPTLIKRMPEPLRQLVGDLSDPNRVIAGLDLPLSISVRIGEPSDDFAEAREDRAPGDSDEPGGAAVSGDTP